ncbi:Choline-sulfatase [Mariniblastus fucicola]|uniref:Choline-sulfatase n=2 Tax=Mariniblastus fucicola TaxID=980251 RepID=A0A5B9PEC4_9BACT|nr:Choline-sulfatase [Mariniblastus fucicola]
MRSRKPRYRYTTLFVVVFLINCLPSAEPMQALAASEPVAKPNIILINLDDADAEMFSDSTLAERFPNLHQLAGRSVKFSNVHATTPLCGPSRACLLRSQYAHHCGIRVNEPDVQASYGFDGGMRSYVERGHASDDLSTWMQDAGYHTMHVGKFLHHQTLFMIPEGWDDFYSSVGGRYFETYRITNRGGPGPYSERLAPGIYRTNAEAADSIELIERQANAQNEKPFFLFLNPFGPHRQQVDSGEMYEDKYSHLWPDATPPESPSYNEADMSDRSGPLKHMSLISPYSHEYLATHFRERLLAMKSVDDMVGDIVATLEEQGLTDNTYIFVTSDNGFALGHHRLVSKGVAVDRATNVPLLVAGPGIDPGRSSHLLAHIDIGPTIVQLAGGSTPSFVDGVSFASVIANPENAAAVRDSVLIENFETRTMFGAEHEFASTGLRLKTAIYVEWATGGREYFNLSRDPDQIENIYSQIPLSNKQTFANKLRKMKSWAPASASFRKPYFDLEPLEYPYTLEGIAESAVSTREVRIAIRDLTTGKFWDGSQWSDAFKQVSATLAHPNAMLTTWKLPLDFGDQPPAGLAKAWVWGLDWSSTFQSPESVTFRLGKVTSRVTLDSPSYAQCFAGTVDLHGSAVSGVQPQLEDFELRIRDVNSLEFWNGNSFSRSSVYLSAQRTPGSWSLSATLPPGTYRVSINGRDLDGNAFDVIHRLFHVDP